MPRPESRRGARQLLTSHRRFVPIEPLYAGRWTSYASQWHARDIDVDLRRGWMWMATWGGVLCWVPAKRLCIRYTSEHGLAGNATRSLAVDETGIVWAGSQDGGLCSLSPDDRTPWRLHDDSESWIVLRLAPRPGGGVYAALRHAEGRCALGEIIPPGYRLRTRRDSLATKEIEALLVDEDETLWVGNAWGLHRRQADGSFRTVESFPHQVRAVADIGGVLWVGTDHGVYSIRADREAAYREDDWPYDQIVSLTVEPETGSKWIATAQEVGRIVDNAWRPLRNVPTGMLNELLTAKPDVETRARLPGHLFREHETWAGGAGGLYRIGVDEYEAAVALDAEDALSNATQCLWVDEAAVWVGTAQGLYRFDGETWQSFDDDAPSLRDVRAIVPGRTGGQLWVGSWQGGLHRLLSGVYVPDPPQFIPIVAMAAGGDGTQWAATPDEVYRRLPDRPDWEPVVPPAHSAIRGPVIQTLYAAKEVLWVGTSAGLWRYRPELGLWYQPPEEEERKRLSIQALARDPLTGHVWVGAQKGLYSADDWTCHREVDVRALAFAPEGTLWLGTATGLERWPPPGDGAVFAGDPEEQFVAAESGLAADTVTALAVRTVDGEREVWIGSPAGVSCYHYSP